MSDKVKLTKEQAEKIEKLLDYHTRDRIVNDFVTAENRSKEGLTLDVLIKALYIGYEVDQTPEEQLVDFFNEQINTDGYNQMATEAAIVKVLDILNIKVKGINE